MCIRDRAMYATGLDPYSGEAVHVPKGREKQIQRAMLHYRDERNRELVEEGLRAVGRTDLIGLARTCLIPATGPRTGARALSGSPGPAARPKSGPRRP